MKYEANSKQQTANSRLKAAGSAIALAIVLVGCGSKTDANEKNFGAAIAQYFDKHGDLCLNLAARKWPVDVEPHAWFNMDKKMAALEALGLATSVDAEVDSPYNSKVKVRVKRYTLTDAAKPFERERQNL